MFVSYMLEAQDRPEGWFNHTGTYLPDPHIHPICYRISWVIKQMGKPWLVLSWESDRKALLSGLWYGV